MINDVYMHENEPVSASRMTPDPSSSPDEFIEIQHHPHSNLHERTIVPLDAEEFPKTKMDAPSLIQDIPDPEWPWAPFRTRADFEFAEIVVTGCLKKDITDKILDGIHGGWAKNTSLTFRTHQDVQDSLASARKFILQFTEAEVSHTFRGKLHTFKFLYRDPWEWIKNLVQDPTLSKDMSWFPVKKFLHVGEDITRIYDEINSGDAWWEYQDSIPQPQSDKRPHCYFPLHIWLDKSNVSTGKKMHPIILRACGLPSQIRNASGNGGGILIGYMPIVGESLDHPQNQSEDLAHFKREVYHRILEMILQSLKKLSIYGQAVMCGDRIVRVLFPGFLIASLDMEEAYCFCATKGNRANYPCPRCLVPAKELHSITTAYQERTEAAMVKVFTSAKSLTPSAADTLLKNNGLHLIQNCFWKMCRSSPYQAYSYDILHSFDSGEWGKHQWSLILEDLSSEEEKSLSQSMAEVPPWPRLKHFDNVVKADFTDGNSFRDILKCIVPCLLSIFEAKSPIFQAIRWCAIFRAILGLKVISERHVLYLEQTVLPEYQKVCTDITEAYGKIYDYPKHHMMRHAVDDLRRKGCIDGYSTRPGEGFQQEVKQAYRQTNYKNVEAQMVRIDENQEAVAQIRMFVDQFDTARESLNDEDLADEVIAREGHLIENNYSLGSRSATMKLSMVETHHRKDSNFSHFASKLLEFMDEIPQEQRPSIDHNTIIQPYKCLYITFRSMEDWRSSKDILRCNTNFHGRERFDFVAINTDPVSFAQLLFVFTCKDSEDRQCDVALVKMLMPSVLKSIQWEGMQAFEEQDVQFISLEYIIRGCHFIPFFSSKKKIYFLNDVIDSDTFVRFFLDPRGLSQ